MVSNNPLFSSTEFFWEDNYGLAEASTMCIPPGRVHGRIDVDFAMKGKVTEFVLAFTKHDDEGDVLYWMYESADNRKVMILND
jgi:hypothetical protein